MGEHQALGDGREPDLVNCACIGINEPCVDIRPTLGMSMCSAHDVSSYSVANCKIKCCNLPPPHRQSTVCLETVCSGRSRPSAVQSLRRQWLQNHPEGEAAVQYPVAPDPGGAWPDSCNVSLSGSWAEEGAPELQQLPLWGVKAAPVRLLQLKRSDVSRPRSSGVNFTRCEQMITLIV